MVAGSPSSSESRRVRSFDRHRLGVGTKLLVAAEEAAREMGFGRLRADLLATNRAAAHLIGKTAPHATITKEGPELVFEWEPGFRQRQAQEVA